MYTIKYNLSSDVNKKFPYAEAQGNELKRRFTKLERCTPSVRDGIRHKDQTNLRCTSFLYTAEEGEGRNKPVAERNKPAEECK